MNGLVLFLILVLVGSVNTEVNEEKIKEWNEVRELGNFIQTSGDDYVRFVRLVSNAVSFHGLLQSQNIPILDHNEDSGYIADNVTTSPDVSTLSVSTRPTTIKPPKFPVSEVCSNHWDAVKAGFSSNQMWAIKSKHYQSLPVFHNNSNPVSNQFPIF